MKKLLLTVGLTMLLAAGCSKSEKTAELVQNKTAPISDSNISESVVNQIMGNELKELNENDGNEIVLKDKLFIAQCNDIYLNPEEYMDKDIRWEGIYTEATNPQTNDKFMFVIRYGPGCCGNDGTAGFEILYDNEPPKMNDWVEAVGRIEMIEEDGNEFVAMRVHELNVLNVRGQEFVSN